MEQKETSRLTLPSNSISYKQNKDPVEEKQPIKLEKVVTSSVKVKKKGFVKRLFAKILADDAQNIKTFIVSDTIIPAIRNLIYDMSVGVLDMSLFGGTRSSRTRRRDGNRSYVSYQSYYDNPKRDRPSDRRERDSRDTLDDIVFESRGEAEMVLTSMIDIIEEYNHVSISNFKELVGISDEFTDHQYGWKNLASAKVNRIRDGYVIDLPRPVLLD